MIPPDVLSVLLSSFLDADGPGRLLILVLSGLVNVWVSEGRVWITALSIYTMCVFLCVYVSINTYSMYLYV